MSATITRLLDDERDRLVAELTDLSDEQWETPSLCAGWTVRDLVAHMLMPYELSIPGFLARLVTAGLNFDRLADRWARHDRRAGPELVRALRSTTAESFDVPGADEAAPLSHLVIHAEDFRRPIGMASSVGPEASSVVLDQLTGGKGRGFVATGLLDDLRFESTETSWTYGRGTVVQGPASALVSAIAGRATSAAELTGDGAEEFRTRLARTHE